MGPMNLGLVAARNDRPGARGPRPARDRGSGRARTEAPVRRAEPARRRGLAARDAPGAPRSSTSPPRSSTPRGRGWSARRCAAWPDPGRPCWSPNTRRTCSRSCATASSCSTPATSRWRARPTRSSKTRGSSPSAWSRRPPSDSSGRSPREVSIRAWFAHDRAHVRARRVRLSRRHTRARRRRPRHPDRWARRHRRPERQRQVHARPSPRRPAAADRGPGPPRRRPTSPTHASRRSPRPSGIVFQNPDRPDLRRAGEGRSRVRPRMLGRSPQEVAAASRRGPRGGRADAAARTRTPTTSATRDASCSRSHRCWRWTRR